MRTKVGIFTVMSLVACLGVSSSAVARGACKRFRPVAPESASTDSSAATKEPVVKVTRKATEAKPLTIEFSHEPALADASLPQGVGMVKEDPKYFNFQIVPKASFADLHVVLKWGAPSASDIDLGVFGSSGQEIATSNSYNPMGGDAYRSAFGGDDDNGLEQIRDLSVSRCEGITVESRASSTPGEDVTLLVWLS